ncbi:MAG: hypothetical protein KDB56_11310 [Mycobacterium sp.]|nr:hypothetical protein [Mycobacterium sp.]
MRPVVLLALAGLFALVLALFTGSTGMALVVVGLAITGIVVLVRDWRGKGDKTPEEEPGPPLFEEFDIDTSRAALKPDEFSPDISTDPDGPSSNARAD